MSQNGKYEVRFFEIKINCIGKMLKYKECYPLYAIGNPQLPSSTWNEKFEIFYEYAEYFFSTKKPNFELLVFSLPNHFLFLFCRDLLNYFL